ncbi:hypothetical protein Lal_00041001 [Lupinus albus]|uniref:Putative transcription factor C2C2-Dof family n=1 Tax=Lupinus albus TaxID=3870 RepID=A0A6A5NQ94_LUPAL|nr:putative transcription factor C2C2-Dof family [Lupinus albus]KAF1887399.1 hypothetical protein Lal_00041001 [Lupinus albus]
MRDPSIMLFGHDISFPVTQQQQLLHHHHIHIPILSQHDKHYSHMDREAENATKKQEADPPSNTKDSKSSGASPEAIVNPKTPSIDEEDAENSKNDNSEKEQSDAGNSQEKTLKKPDKLVPCPRCNSMDTKFCYYNNYNVNQPRYFCKACQRYWTAGGTMRNVPVGAGRRKNKNSTSHYPHIIISEALQAARIDSPDGNHHPMLKSNGRVLSFGLDHAPICDSMASVLNLGDKKVLNCATRNEFHSFEDGRFPVPCKSGENSSDSIGCSNTSTITVSCSNGKSTKSTFHEPALGNNNSFIPQVPWPYPWNFPVPSPAFCPSGYPLSFYPAAFWNCPCPCPMPGSSPNSPTLGKHSRDGDIINQENLHKEEPSKQRNGCVLVPKTLRIDDPSEAAKSSIWATLGIKNESLSGGGMFKAFQSTKKDEKKHMQASPVLRANPAAFSRSLDFHENS